MIRKEYSNLGEIVYEARLSNGLLTRVVTKPGFAKTYAFLAVDYGSIDSSFSVNGRSCVTPDGVAHFLEHKMFDLPEGSAMQQFAKQGGTPNAFTSYDMTAYYVECTDHVSENLKTLLHMVSTPYFTEESVEKEQGIIAQEIRMYDDSADSKVYEDLFENLFAHHPVRRSIAGTEQSIREITAQTLYDCHDAFYRPENMMLVVVGDVEPAEIMEIAEHEIPGKVPVVLTRDYGPAEELLPVCGGFERKMEIAMPMFALGFKAAPGGCGRDAMLQEVTAELAAEILSGESTPLYQKMYYEGIIDSSFSIGYEGLKAAAALTAGGDSEDPMAVRDAILEEAVRLHSVGLDEELFNRLKKSSIGRRIRNLDSFESICYRMCAYHFEGADYFDFPEAYDAVSLDTVAKFLDETVLDTRSSLCIVRPMEKEAPLC